jgi:hypothetical protein
MHDYPQGITRSGNAVREEAGSAAQTSIALMERLIERMAMCDLLSYLLISSIDQFSGFMGIRTSLPGGDASNSPT